MEGRHYLGMVFAVLIAFVVIKFVLRKTQYGSFAEMF